MLKRFKFKSRVALGIDIGPASVKVLEMSIQGGKPCIEAYGYEPLPSNSVESNGRALTLALKRLLLKINSSAKHAALAAPDPIVISKIIQLPENLNDLELEELAFHEAKSLIVTSEEMCVDFVVLGKSRRFSGMLDLLLVACRTENIERRLEAVKNAGLRVKIVDIESYAIARVITELFTNAQTSTHKIIAVIDIAYQSTRVCVIDEGRVSYVREETFGIKQLFDATAQHYNLSQAEVTRLQEQEFKPEDYEVAIFKPFIELALLHIKRSLQFFFADCHYEYIDQIYLAGEKVDLVQLAKRIQEEEGISTAIINPLKQIAIANHLSLEEFTQLAPSFLVSFGLTLRQLYAN